MSFGTWGWLMIYHDARVLVAADVFDKIHDFVMTEAPLQQFAGSTLILTALARDLRAGKPATVVVPINLSLRIPTYEYAKKLLDLVHETPSPGTDEEPDFVRTMAILHTNLAHAVVFAIMQDYRGLMTNGV